MKTQMEIQELKLYEARIRDGKNLRTLFVYKNTLIDKRIHYAEKGIDIIYFSERKVNGTKSWNQLMHEKLLWICPMVYPENYFFQGSTNDNLFNTKEDLKTWVDKYYENKGKTFFLI